MRDAAPHDFLRAETADWLPRNVIVPDATRAMPLMARNKVDFPAPLAPRMATRRPVSTLIETSRKASTEP
jgi:hypothetical protein